MEIKFQKKLKINLNHLGYFTGPLWIRFKADLNLPISLLESILNETSKPPPNIFSNILTYIIHKWLQFTLNMEKSIKLNLSKFHFHKLKLTCSIDRLYKGTIAFHFHTNAKIWTHRLKSSIPGTLSEKHQLYGVINGHYWTFLGFAFIK